MNNPLLVLSIVLSVALLVFDAVWLATLQPFTLHPSDLRTIAKTLAILAAVAVVAGLVRRRLTADQSKITMAFKYFATSTRLLALTGGYMIFVSTTMAAANYLLMTTALPLQDNTFAAIDSAMGFDWLAILSWVDARAWVSWVLVTAYSSSLIQMMAVIFIYSALQREDRLLEFSSLFALTGIAVGVIAALVPAIGAYAYYKPDPSLYDQFTNLGRVHVPVLEQLRAGTFARLEFDNTVGMVSFPSFHTVLAIIVTYAFRDQRFLFTPIFVLNCVVVASTIPEGGHYLIDIFGGAAIAAASIIVVRSLQNSHHARTAQKDPSDRAQPADLLPTR